MATITFTIDNEKLPRVVAALKGLYRIPKDSEGTPLFTDSEWAKEAVRRLLVRIVFKWENKVAKDAVTVASEDDLIS